MSNLNIREVESGFVVTINSKYPGEPSKEYAFETPWALSAWIGKYLNKKQVDRQVEEQEKQRVEQC